MEKILSPVPSFIGKRNIKYYGTGIIERNKTPELLSGKT